MNDGSSLGTFVILLLPLLLIVWMAMSARRRQRTMDEFQGSLAVGEEVVTTSGIYGRLTSVQDTTADLEIAPGTTIRIDKRAIGVRTADLPDQGQADGTTDQA
jgi:preprotein translocase subunit YajC